MTGRQGSTAAEAGQATLEVALAFPVIAIMLLALVQVTLVVRDQVATIHAAREGARAAVVSGAAPGDGDAAARAATALDPARLAVEVNTGGLIRVTVRYRAPTDVPIIGRLIGDITLQATAVMRVEP